MLAPNGVRQRRTPIVPGRFQPSIVSTSELNCRVRDEQRLRAPPVADSASRGWRSGRKLPSDSEVSNFRAPQELGCTLTVQKKRGQHTLSSLFMLAPDGVCQRRTPIVPGRLPLLHSRNQSISFKARARVFVLQAEQKLPGGWIYLALAGSVTGTMSRNEDKKKEQA